ncbi:MAG: filament integrity protein FraC [Elainellaceae cyanobacterium]
MYLSYMLPLTVVLTQALLMLLAIAIEAVVIQRQLQFAPRKSIEYSASVNLLSTVLGWFVFFVMVETVPLPETLELEVLNLVFFDQPVEGGLIWLLTLGLITFFGTIVVESIGFTMLQWLLDERKPIEEETRKSPRRMPWSVKTRSRNMSAAQDPDTIDPLRVLVWANSFSYIMILAVLVAVRIALTFQET